MVNFLPTIRLAKSVLKRKFPSVYKPLQKYVPQKRPLKNISPGAYFRNFTVYTKHFLFIDLLINSRNLFYSFCTDNC